MWLIDHKRDLAVSCLPKCATHSLREFFDWAPTVNNREVIDVGERVAFIREPFDRLVSNYSYFSSNNGNMHGWSYEQFVDFILDQNPRHFHWGPQVKSLTYKGDFVPNLMFRFDDINKAWMLTYGVKLNFLNTSEHKEVSNYRKEELTDYFSEDINAYNQI